MKPLFAIDITQDKRNETVNGSEFITQTVSKQKSEELEKKSENLIQTIEESKLPLRVRIIKAICGYYFLIVLVNIVEPILSIGFDQAFRNAPILIISAFLCGLVWIFLQFVAKRKEKHVLTEQNAEQQDKEIGVDIQSIYEELNVPSDAACVDILLFHYKIKNEKIIPKELAFQTTPYLNVDFRIYVKDDYLCLADLENVYSFPLSGLKAIRTVNKRISVPTWNKDEGPTTDKFKQYKLTENNVADTFFKPYHILEIDHNGEIFGIYFPCYDLPAFESLTGLKAEAPTKK